MPYSPAPRPTAPELPAGPVDIRLVVTDMDGTLLDDAIPGLTPRSAVGRLPRR